MTLKLKMIIIGNQKFCQIFSLNVTDHSVKYYAIPSNNSSVTEKHVVEDDILFTNPLAGKGLKICGLVHVSIFSVVGHIDLQCL